MSGVLGLEEKDQNRMGENKSYQKGKLGRVTAASRGQVSGLAWPEEQILAESWVFQPLALPLAEVSAAASSLQKLLGIFKGKGNFSK